MTDLSPEQIKQREDFYRQQDKARKREEAERRRRRSQARNPGPGKLLPSQLPARRLGEQETAVIANPGSGVVDVTVVPSGTPVTEEGSSRSKAEIKPEAEPSLAEAEIKPESEPSPAEAEIKPEAKPDPATAEAEQVRIDAENALQDDFPGLSIRIFNLDKESIEFANDKAGSLPELVKRTLGDFLTDYERTNMTIDLLKDGNGIRIKATAQKPIVRESKWEAVVRKLRLESMARKLGLESVARKLRRREPDPFSFNQHIYEEKGKPVLYIESITAQGRGKTFFKETVLPRIAEYNLSKIKLQAFTAGQSSEGQVAWARYGFIPSQDSWDIMRERGQEILAERAYSAVSSQVMSIFEDTSPKALRRLIVLAWKERKERRERGEDPKKSGPITTLLNRILQARLWDGEIDLNDPKNVEWLTMYVNVKTPEDQLDQFEALL